MRPDPRVDYDVVADRYDDNQLRRKDADPELTKFLGQRGDLKQPVALDLACGTGYQLVANRAAFPSARLVGLDRFAGMLRQARRKGRHMPLVQADAAAAPFPDASCDFISCQYSFHHVEAKLAMLAEALRLLRPDGRFVLTNICPQEMPDWLVYQYFPEALDIDLQDFWPPDLAVRTMERLGFQRVEAELQHLRSEQNLGAFLEHVRHPETCSNLLVIAAAAYTAGLRRLQREIGEGVVQRPDHTCLLTIRGEKG